MIQKCPECNAEVHCVYKDDKRDKMILLDVEPIGLLTVADYKIYGKVWGFKVHVCVKKVKPQPDAWKYCPLCGSDIGQEGGCAWCTRSDRAPMKPDPALEGFE